MRFVVKLFVVSVLVGVFASANPVCAQKKQPTKKQLQSQQKKIEGKIGYTKKLLSETKNKKRASLNQLSLLERQVQERRRLISAYGSEIKLIDSQIEIDKKNIQALEEELSVLKEEYANLIYQSYKSRSNYDQWMFIFASKDFYQAMRRARYLKEYSAYRRQKAEEIVSTQLQLKEEIASLERQKEERLGVLITKENETQELEKDRRKKALTLTELKQQESSLRQQLKKQEREWNRLNKEVQRLIEEEFSKDNNRLSLSPAEVQLSQNFAGNVGKLPWPIERGEITLRFGKRKHPDLDLYIDNKGVDFRCEKGSSVRAVFKGKVTRVVQLPQFKAILVKHGDYITVYSRLNQVFVKVGDEVTYKQKLGTLWTDNESGETVLHFELWHRANLKNPEKWLLRR